MPTDNNSEKEKGKRSEEVAQWYFRLNGFFCLPSYIVHKDWIADKPRTEADLIAVRMSGTKEYINNERLEDDNIIQTACKGSGTGIFKHLFALVEVKSGECKINGPWSNKNEENIHRAVARMGFANDNQIEDIAQCIYNELRWEGKDFIVQYFCIGKWRNKELASKPELVQITFDQIADFLYCRFYKFPEKIPAWPILDEQWPGFGGGFAHWFDARRHNSEITEELCRKAVINYIYTGKL